MRKITARQRMSNRSLAGFSEVCNTMMALVTWSIEHCPEREVAAVKRSFVHYFKHIPWHEFQFILRGRLTKQEWQQWIYEAGEPRPTDNLLVLIAEKRAPPDLQQRLKQALAITQRGK